MKKTFTIVLALFSALTVLANGDKTETFSAVKEKDMVQGGFYLHLGLGVPTYKVVGSGNTVSLGLQPSLEIGNQWMFHKGERFGFGMNVSWLTAGFSVKSNKINHTLLGDINSRTSSLYLSLLKFGPMATFATNTVALDIFVNVTPTLYLGTNRLRDLDERHGYAMSGVAFTPGVKFRLKVITLGFEAHFGRLHHVRTGSSSDEDIEIDWDYKANYFNPRVFVGLKF